MDEKRDEKGPPRGLANPDRLGSEREEKERVVAAFPFVSPRGSGASSALGYPGASFFKPPRVSRLVEAERVAARVAGSALSAILAAADVEDLSSGRAPSFSVGDALASFAISLACSDDAETHAAIAPAIEALLVAAARDLGGGSFSFSEPGSSTEPDRTEPMVDRVSATRPRDEKASLAARSLTDPGGGAFLGAASLVASRSMRASRSVSHRLATLASASRPFARLAGSDSQLTNGLVRAVRRFAEPPGWEEEAARRRALFLRGHARLSGRVESVGGGEFGGAAIVGGGEHLHERDERDADREAGGVDLASPPPRPLPLPSLPDDDDDSRDGEDSRPIPNRLEKGLGFSETPQAATRGEEGDAAKVVSGDANRDDARPRGDPNAAPEAALGEDAALGGALARLIPVPPRPESPRSPRRDASAALVPFGYGYGSRRHSRRGSLEWFSSEGGLSESGEWYGYAPKLARRRPIDQQGRYGRDRRRPRTERGARGARGGVLLRRRRAGTHGRRPRDERYDSHGYYHGYYYHGFVARSARRPFG